MEGFRLQRMMQAGNLYFLNFIPYITIQPPALYL